MDADLETLLADKSRSMKIAQKNSLEDCNQWKPESETRANNQFDRKEKIEERNVTRSK